MDERRVRIEIDLNVRVRGGQTFAGYEDVDPSTVTRARASHADGPVGHGDKVLVCADDIIGDALVIGERVIAFERESGLACDACIADVDGARRLVYLKVDWQSFRDDPEFTPDQ